MAEDWIVEGDGRGDTELTDAYRNGDETAAAELYRRYYLKLLRGVATKLPSKEIAEDCVGEAFLSVLEIIRRGSGPTSNFYGYVRSAVVRESAKYFRDRELGPTLDEATEEGARQLAVDDDVSHIEESLLQPALRSLPKKWRDIVTLRYVENLKPAQIATMLDTEAPALHKMLYRAKNGLRDEYLKQIALSRSSTSCREFSSDLAALATSGGKAVPGSGLEMHLLTCVECQATLVEIKHQSRRVSPEALGVVLLVGGIAAGSTLALGGGSSKASALSESSTTKAATTTAGETAARSTTVLKTLASTGKVASVGGIFQTLGPVGTITIGALLVGSLTGAGLVYASSVSQSEQAGAGSTVVQQETQGKPIKKTVRTDDGDCELNMTIDNGTLIVDAAVHAGKCWFTYNRVGDEPRGEQRVSTGWMIVTRVSGDYEFVLRSTKSSERGTITL